jgi:hypothetical protein
VKLDNGSWDGIMGMVQRGEVHLGNVIYAYTGDHLEAVDYLNPISSLR